MSHTLPGVLVGRCVSANSAWWLVMAVVVVLVMLAEVPCVAYNQKRVMFFCFTLVCVYTKWGVLCKKLYALHVTVTADTPAGVTVESGFDFCIIQL